MRISPSIIFINLFMSATMIGRSQTSHDSLVYRQFRTLEMAGDDAWSDRDTALARNYYQKALEIDPDADEIQYRIDHLNARSTCKFDKNVNQFFDLIDDGDYARKDHCMNYAIDCYQKALDIAEQPGYEELKESDYYKWTQEKIKDIKRHRHPWRLHLF